MSIMDLMPYPSELVVIGDGVELEKDATIWSNSSKATDLLRDLLGKPMGFPFHAAAEPNEAKISLVLDATAPAGEGYQLKVADGKVTISSQSETGIFWGIQTLRQLLPSEIFARKPVTGVKWQLPGVLINDAPQFSWRGTLLDVSRWYKPVSFIYRYIDLAAMHKLNVLHLHLNDDQGWRFEVKRYPKLTEIGAWRKETIVGRWDSGISDGTPHGGFYSQQELRDLVAYARSRGVVIMPEIDVPGHCQAAIATYPELGNHPEKQLEVATNWGVITHVMNVEESTIDFVKHVFDELLEVFDSEYIHIGGDECPKDEWKTSPRAQELMKQRGLKDENELQSWFLEQIVQHLEANGRKAIGWDEIREGGIPGDAAVMSWWNMSGGIEAAKLGHKVVMSPTSQAYYDHYQISDTESEPIAQEGVVTLEDAYNFNPMPTELSEAEAKNILGAQFALWCEYIPTPSHAEYMAFPRACAFSELAWGKSGLNFADFRKRLVGHLKRLDVQSVNYRKLD